MGNNIEDVIELLEESKEIQIKSFILDLCYENEEIAEKLKLTLGKKEIFHSIDYYKKEVESIVKSYSKKGIFDYSHATKFSIELSKYLDNHLLLLIDKNEKTLAFDILFHVSKLLGKFKIDGSNKQLDSIRLSLLKNFKCLLDISSYKEQLNYFDKMLSVIRRGVYCSEVVRLFEDSLSLFDDEFTDIRLKYFKEKMDNRINTDSDDANKYIVEYAKQLIFSGYIDQFNQLFAKWPNLHDLKILKANITLQNQGESEALKLLELFEEEAVERSQKLQFATISKNIFLNASNTESLCNKIIQVAKEYSYITYKEYCLLKENLDAKTWFNHRSIFLDAIKNETEAIKVYYYEREYQRILEFPVDKIKKDLKAWEYMSKNYSCEFISKYELKLYKYFEKPTLRRKYRKYAKVLYDLLEIPGGHEKAKEIKANLIRKYPSRIAMVEELNNIEL